MKPSSSALLQRLLARGKFRHLQVLLKLAELGSVQRTADAIGMTQSAVTQALAYVESLLEVRLFQRHARGVRPTAICTDLLPVARQLLQGIAQGAEILAVHHHAGMQTVRVAASAAAIHGMLVKTLTLFESALPGIQVLLTEEEGEDQLLAIARGEVDLVACRRPAEIPQGWVFEPLVSDRLVVVCAPEHRLMHADCLAWQDLANETWLLMPTGSAAREKFDDLAASFGQSPRAYPLVTRTLMPIAWLLRARGLLSLMPMSVVRHLVDTGEMAVLPVDVAGEMEPLGLLMPKEQSGQASVYFAEFLKSCCALAEV
jgi:DNA-binding transcriptional LysR family regulator